MQKFYKVLIFFIIGFILFNLNTSYGENNVKNVCANKENQFLVAFPDNLAPWSMIQNDKPTGYLIDLMRVALSQMDKCLEIRMLPLTRINQAFRSADVMAIAWGDDRFNTPEMHHAIKSMPVGILLPEFIFFKDSGIHLKDVSDLKKISIIAFQGTSIIWPEIGKFVAGNPDYQEIANQRLQVQAFFLRKHVMLITDLQIFLWWWHQGLKSHDSNYSANIQMVPVDTLLHKSQRYTPLSIIFRDEKIRDQFNKVFLKMKADGEVKKILNKYNMNFQ